MHTLVPFLIGFSLYCIICRLSYVSLDNYRSLAYIIAGIGGGLGNIAWMYVAQTSSSNKEILIKGLLWDGMITSIYLFLPLLLLDISGLSMYNKFGIGLMFLGIILVKV